MKRVFISHPFRNDPDKNVKEILEIGKHMAKLGIAYFSPITNYCAIDDADAKMREFGLKCCEEWIPQCDEFWLCGDWATSAGCQRELAMANSCVPEVVIRIVRGWENELPIFKGPWPDWLKFR